jgi:radical SAM superfamily enzyme YgiQ (UPF0313 family)
MGVKTKAFVFSARDVKPEIEHGIVDAIVAAGTDIIAIGAYVWNVVLVRRVLGLLRGRGSRALIVIGGPEVTYAPIEELPTRFVGANCFVRGAGEDALVQLARGARDIEGVVQVAAAGRAGFATVNLAGLPSPYLDGVLVVNDDEPMVRWETARGCSYACSFCAHPGEPEQRRIRTRNLDVLRQEVALFARHRVKRINVLDPLFNASPEHAIAVLKELSTADFKGSLTFQCRFLAMRSRTAELLDRFAALDVELEFGIQTTDEHVGDAVARRSELKPAEKTIRELQRLGINFSVSLIYGLPEQTLASFKDSLRWCRDMGVPTVRSYPLSLLVGTDLWHRQKKLGLVEGFDERMGDVPVVIETPTMSRDDMLCAAEAARASTL